MSTAPFAWTHEKTRVEFDGRSLTVNDRSLPLDDIQRLARDLSVSTAQGSWNRLTCNVHLFANGKVTSVRFRGDASKEEWGPWRPLWEELDALIRDEIEPRLLERTTRQVDTASSAEIVRGYAKGRPKFIVTAETLQRKSWRSKPVSWASIIAMSDGEIEVVIEEADGKQRKQSLGLHSMLWDGWQVPQLWRHYAAR